MSLTLRPATAADSAALTELLRACFVHYFGVPDGADRAAQALLSPKARTVETLIALDDGRPLGFASFAVVYPSPEGRGTLFLKDLFVSAEARGRSLGARMMRHLAREAVRRDCIRFDWTAETTNPRALAFYDALGAARVQDKVYYRLDGPALTAMAEQSDSEPGSA